MSKKIVKKKEVKEEKQEKEEKMGLWAKFMNFCHGVKVESKRIHWTDKKDLVKYSITTFAFVLFFSLFFYVVNVVYALIQSVLG